jgi:lipopolysaccharide biosynthesis protein
MKVEEKSLCVFIHYSEYPSIPKSVRIYIEELSNYFDQVILVTNQRVITTGLRFPQQNISTTFVKNEGYDLGMFYKIFLTIDTKEYSQIACINDSNILFNELFPVFNWSKKSQFDFWGIIDSDEKPWFSTHQNNHHIQTHFIVFNQKAVAELPSFFKSINIKSIFEENDPIELRRLVIDKWEIGLTQFLTERGLSSGSYVDSQSFSQLHHLDKTTNIGHKLYVELIHSGLPLLKKKIITQKSWKDIFHPKKQWEKLIRQYGNPDWNIDELIDELIQIENESENQSIIKIKTKLWEPRHLLLHEKTA